MITVVSWNLNHWQQGRGRRPAPAAAWEYLRTELKADVALVQEAALPTGFDAEGSVGLFAGPTGRRWGTGIVDLTGVGLQSVSEFASPDRKASMELRWTVPEAAAAAYVGQGPEGFLAVSLYGQFAGGSSYATMLHHAAHLAPLFADFKRTRRSLIAGDFNLNGQWTGDQAWYNRLERTILSTLTMWGMSDIIADADLGRSPDCGCEQPDCRHIQTYWKPGSVTPWQNDHALASLGLKVTSVAVDAKAVVDHQLSDHAPIVMRVS